MTSLIHFATETFCVYRAKGMPMEVAYFKTHLETLKFNLVSCYKENVAPTEQNILDLQYIANNDEFRQMCEDEFNKRFSIRKLRIVN